VCALLAEVAAEEPGAVGPGQGEFHHHDGTQPLEVFDTSSTRNMAALPDEPRIGDAHALAIAEYEEWIAAIRASIQRKRWYVTALQSESGVVQTAQQIRRRSQDGPSGIAAREAVASHRGRADELVERDRILRQLDQQQSAGASGGREVGVQ
jgi:hypothetical protein